jgi:hypothetical protein
MVNGQVIPAEAVWKAGCLECDWRYYVLTEERAHVCAISHSDEDGHGVKVVVLEGSKND